MFRCARLLVMVVAMAIMSANLQAGVIPSEGLFEGFEAFDTANLTIPTAAPDLVGFPSAGAAVTTATKSEGNSSLLAGGRANGANPATAYFSINLGGSYDFYAGGNGKLTFDIRKWTGPVYRAAVLLYSNDVQVGQSSMVSFANNDWKNYSVNLTDQATDVDKIKIYISRIGTDTSAAYVCVDNLQYSVPEPATMGLLSVGGLLVVSKKATRN